MSDEGADELTRVLIYENYGNEKELARDICERRPELAARIYDIIENDKDLKNNVEDIIVNKLADEEDEYYDLDEVI